MKKLSKIFIPVIIAIVIIAVLAAGCVSENTSNQTVESESLESANVMLDTEKIAEEQYNQGKAEVLNRNKDEAIKWYIMAANNGSADAISELNSIYNLEDGIKVNSIESFNLATKAAEAGSMLAMMALVDYYLTGTGLVDELIDYDKWFEWASKAAQGGDAVGMDLLAFCYYKGYGVVVDDSKAFEWFKKSAELGCEDAYGNVANCYLYGIGTEVNKEEGMKWLKKMVELGDKDALTRYINLGGEIDSSVAVSPLHDDVQYYNAVPNYDV